MMVPSIEQSYRESTAAKHIQSMPGTFGVTKAASRDTPNSPGSELDNPLKLGLAINVPLNEYNSG